MKQIIIILAAVFALSGYAEATPRLINSTRNYIGVVADTSSVQGSTAGCTYYATDELRFYISNGVSWIPKAGDLGSTVINVSAGGFVLSDSLTTDYGIEEKGTAWVDSTHIKNGAVTGTDLVNPFRFLGKAVIDTVQTKSGVDTGYHITNGVGIVRGGLTVIGITASDTVQAVNATNTGYHVTNGAGIVRGGETVTGIAAIDTIHVVNDVATGYRITNGAVIVRGGITTTGSASADTTKGANAAFTGYGIVNGATILRGGATITGNITATGTTTFQAFNSPVQAILADSTLTASRSGYTYIARPVAAKTTATLPAAAAGLAYTFLVADSDSLLLKAAGSDSLIDGTGAAWKTTSSVAGSIKVIGTAGKWFLFSAIGTWTSY